MPQDNTSQAATKPTARSRVTNGSALLPGVDGRSKWARRLRDLVTAYSADLGDTGDMTETQRTMVRRVATISVELERWEVEFAKADNVSAEDFARYQTASKTQRALMESLGLLQPSQRAPAPAGGNPLTDSPTARHIARGVLRMLASNAHISDGGAVVGEAGFFTGDATSDTGDRFTSSDQEGAGTVTTPSPSKPSPPAEPEQKIEMIGSDGHWIEWKETDREGREKWAVCNPAGVPIGNVWGKDKARDAAEMFILTGGITA